MKRIGYIYEKIYEKENIRNAIIRVAKGKRKRKVVRRILANIDFYIDEIHDMLRNETYTPTPYIRDIINNEADGKVREIFKPQFYPDQIIQWCILLQLEPIFMRGMYKYTCGSVPKRGIIYGKKYLEPKIQNDLKGTKYYVKMDIKKFYPSCDNDILFNMLKTKIKCEKTLNLLKQIIYLEKGLPIGTILSQWFSNFYLQGLDHFIKEKLGIKYYLRYVDDMVIVGSNKRKLHKARIEIMKYLENIKLRMTWQLRWTDEGLDMLGFRFFRNTTILRKRTMLRATRRVKKASKKPKFSPHDCMAIMSYLGRFKHCSSYVVYKNWVKPYIKISKLKSIISQHRKEQNNDRNTKITNRNILARKRYC